jgi:cell wall-associated NlpC family hydrolase
LTLLVSACAGTPGYEADRRPQTAPGRAGIPDSSGAPLGHAVAELALDLIGTPYLYGGSDPGGFDCSGLVYYTYRTNGVPVPRNSLDQFRFARKISLRDAAGGDLVFFQDEARLSHVGIYLGDNMFVHAPASGRQVSIASLEAPYYQEHLVGVGRLLPN